MAVAKDRNVAFGCHRSIDRATHTRRDILRGFAAGNAVMEDRPRRIGLADFGGCSTLILAVVPFPHILAHLCLRKQPCEFACPHGTATRACEYQPERVLGKDRPKQFRASLALGRQGHIGARCVTPAQAPFGFAVADEEDALSECRIRHKEPAASIPATIANHRMIALYARCRD